MNHSYLAGLFDGEGCITVGKSYSNLRIRVTVVNTYLPVLLKIRRKYGGSIHEQKKGVFTWWYTTKTVEKFLKDIYPYLIIKKEQVKIGLKFLETMGQLKQGRAKIMKERKMWKKKLQELKRERFQWN